MGRRSYGKEVLWGGGPMGGRGLSYGEDGYRTKKIQHL